MFLLNTALKGFNVIFHSIIWLSKDHSLLVDNSIPIDAKGVTYPGIDKALNVPSLLRRYTLSLSLSSTPQHSGIPGTNVVVEVVVLLLLQYEICTMLPPEIW